MINNPYSLTVLNIIGRLLNFVLFITVANKFGVTPFTDWFFFVYGIVYFFIGIFFYATESALVPTWHRLKPHQQSLLLFDSFRLAIVGTVLVAGFIFLAGFILAPALTIELPFSTKDALIVCLLLSIQPTLGFLSAIFSSFLQYEGKYVLPTVHLAIRSLGILALLLVPGCETIQCLAMAYLLGESVRFFCLKGKKNFVGHVRKKTDHNTLDYLRPIYQNVIWMTVALTFVVINPVVDLAMVGKFGPGAVSLVEYAGRLRGLPVLSLGGVLVYFLGDWSRQHHQQKDPLRWIQVQKVFGMVLFTVTCAVGLLILLEQWWVPLLFFSRKFSVHEHFLLQELLFWYFLGVPLLAGSMILSRAIIVLEQTRLLAITALATALMNILLNLLFMKTMGLKGVALATTIVDITVCVVYYFSLRHCLFAVQQST
jgi:putative peptidoglycan lipid II flippase